GTVSAVRLHALHGHVVLGVPVRQSATELTHALTSLWVFHPALVDRALLQNSRGDRRLAGQDLGVLRRAFLVLLDELPAGQLLDRAALITVLEHLSVTTLQTQADPLGDDEGDDRADDRQDPEDVGRQVQVDREGLRQDVVRTGQPQHTVEGDTCDTHTGTDRGVAGTVGHVVRTLVPGDPLLEERPHGQTPEDDARDHQARYQDRDHERIARDREVEPVREDPQGPLHEAHVPVGLQPGGDGRRGEGTEQVNRVDLHKGTQTRGHREGQEEEPSCLDRERREHGRSDHGFFGSSLTWILSVFLVPQDHDVRGDQRQQQCRDQQHMQYVQPRDDVHSGEYPTEQEHREVRTDQRDRQQHTLEDAHAHARGQVVRQGVAEETFDHGQGEEGHTDQPVELTRFAERSGEEHTEHVDHQRGHEDQRGPMVDLSHEE